MDLLDSSLDVENVSETNSFTSPTTSKLVAGIVPRTLQHDNQIALGRVTNQLKFIRKVE